MVLIIQIIVGILCGIFIIGDAKKRNMSAGWSLLGFLFNLIGLVIYIIARKPIGSVPLKNDSLQNNNVPQSYNSPILTSKESQSIPDNCPHCKNPNTKRIRLCEWCGNQIC
jgi:hypothetical protein